MQNFALHKTSEMQTFSKKYDFVFLRFQYTDPLQLKVGSRSVNNYLDPQLWLTVSVFTNMHANKGCENFKRRFQSISSIFIKSDRLGKIQHKI